MSSRQAFAIVQRLLIVLVLAASGGYLLIYLYRWEWNRALISGVVFVAAEVALATSLLYRRLGSNGKPSASFDLALARLRDAGVQRPSPFRWLVPRDRLGVFIPVLLGAGVVLSALAYVVERIAEGTARLTVDRHLARRLAVLAPARPPSAPVELLQWQRAPRRAGPVAGLVAAAVIIGLTVQLLAQATQSRPDGADLPASTTIVLTVEQRSVAPLADTAAALWVACRPVLPGHQRPGVRLDRVDDHLQIVLEPGIGRLATRRLTGCFNDATLTRVRASVLDVRHHATSP